MYAKLYKTVIALLKPIASILPNRLRNWGNRSFIKLFSDPLDYPEFNIIENGPLTGYSIFASHSKSLNYINGSHEPEVTRWLLQSCQPGDKVIDLGSHQGYFTLLLSKLVGESGHVYAFEPIPNLFQGIAQSLKKNHISNVTLENKAVGEITKQALIYLQKSERSASHSFTRVDDESNTMEVEMISLADYFSTRDWPKIKLAKIDVEGYEGEVIEGMSRLLKQHQPLLILELHLWKDPSQLIKNLADLNYNFRLLNGEHFSLDTTSRDLANSDPETLSIVAMPS